MATYIKGYTCETVTGQVDKPAAVVQSKKIDLLGSAWRLACTCQVLALRNCIDGAGLADIRATGKCDFRAVIRRPLGGRMCAQDELG